MINRAVHDAVKPLAKRLGATLASRDGTVALRLIEELVATLAGEAAEPAHAEPGAAPDRIGIWRLHADGARYVRDPATRAEWELWADVEQFAAAKPAGTQRIVVIGESVARGMFYAPLFTPALALGHALAGGGEPVEVIDLSRTDLGMAELRGLLAASAALAPDAIVVFAGNNWSLDPGQLADQFLADTLRAGHGLGDIYALCDELLAAQVAELCAQLAAVAARVVFAIPEFNLADWSCAATRPIVPWLDGSASAAWMALRSQLEAAERAADDALLEQIAQQMVELDRGTSPVALEALGRLHARRGATALARGYLERARDAMTQRSELWPPRCRGVVQAALREHLPAAGVAVVDVPAVLARASDGALPGRRFFVDYCHLTSEAITLVMRAVAQVLRPDAGDPGPLAPTAEQEAQAYLLAAIHSAHWGQPRAQLTALCERAVACSPRAREWMALYVAAKASTLPDEMTPAYQELRRAGAQLRGHLPALPTGRALMDVELVATMLGWLPEGTDPWRARASDARVDLLDELHHLASFGDMGESAGPYRAFDVRSTFRFVVGEPRDLELVLVARAGGEAALALELAGQPLARVDVARTWRRARVTIPHAALRPGLNTLVVHWPPLAGDSAAFVAELCAELDLGARLPLYPIYGELATLELRHA